MSGTDLQDRVRSYESLLDRLHEAGESERSQLLAAYARERKGSQQAVDSQSNGHSAQADEVLSAYSRIEGTSGVDQDATLAVLGCGLQAPITACLKVGF